MSQICIINNSLDEAENEFIESENALLEFLKVRKTHPQARIYLGNPCPENDITPIANDEAGIQRIIDLKEDCTIVCMAGDAIGDALAFINPINWLAAKATEYAFKQFLPKIGGIGDGASGSSNNNLASPENKQRIKERIPYIIGRVKSIPDLYAPPYRYFRDGVEVEELLLCVCENPVRLSQFKSGDTDVSQIDGKSLTAYGLNQNITGLSNIYQVGEIFNEAPLIAKQSPAVNGQTLLNPNATYIEKDGIYFQYPNQIRFDSATSEINEFDAGETLIIDWADYLIADQAITGPVEINAAESTIIISSSTYSPNALLYRKINITAMLVNDPVNGQLDLAGNYNIESISYQDSKYTIVLKDPILTNADFEKITDVLFTNISATLADNAQSITLNGSYSVASVSEADRVIYLASPSTTNPDWNDLTSLSGNRTPSKRIQIRGSQFNYIGWFTLDSQGAEGVLLNFIAPAGIYEGDWARSVVIEAQFQQVVNDEPVGEIYTQNATVWGKNKSRDSVGVTIKFDLPFIGAFRFRARRTNDNGSSANLVDEMKFYQAYAFHKLEKLVYDNRVIVRERTFATRNATAQESRQLNCIAESLIYTYQSGAQSANRIASRNLADVTIDLALNSRIGRRTLSEIDIDRMNAVYSEVVSYFGSSKMAEFNWTLDKTNTSFEELMRMIAFATGTHDRRVNRKIYYDLESAENDPIILFNHRNKAVKTESRGYGFRTKTDGIEITYVDSENGWVEKILKIPSEQITNPRKIDGTGIIYKEQAHIIAWREWNKTVFSREVSTFTAYCESDLVFRGDCVLNTDDTRMENSTSGEILAWVGLDIVGSQPFEFTDDHVIHLQMKSGGIDVISVSQGVDEYTFKLARAPRESLVTEGEVKTLYTITSKSKEDSQKFLVTSKNPKGIFENEVTLSKFDERFYRNDKDIINGII